MARIIPENVWEYPKELILNRRPCRSLIAQDFANLNNCIYANYVRQFVSVGGYEMTDYAWRHNLGIRVGNNVQKLIKSFLITLSKLSKAVRLIFEYYYDWGGDHDSKTLPFVIKSKNAETLADPGSPQTIVETFEYDPMLTTVAQRIRYVSLEIEPNITNSRNQIIELYMGPTTSATEFIITPFGYHLYEVPRGAL